MKIKLIIALFVVLFVGMHPSYNKEADFINYHLTVHHAEKYIQQNKFDSAVYVYEEIFKKYPHCFYKDLHNLCLCYLRLDDLDKAYKSAEKLVLKGYELSDFEDNTSFVKLTVDKKWARFIKRYKKLRKQYLELTNAQKQNRQAIYKIAEIDDNARDGDGAGDLDAISYKCGKQLEGIFQEKGFPAFMSNKDTLSHRMTIVLRHYYHIKSYLPYCKQEEPYTSMVFDGKLDSILKNAIHTGLLLPEHYVDITTYSYSNNPYGERSYTFDFKKENITIGLYPANGYDTINIKRKKIGLPPIDPTDTCQISNTWLEHFSFKEVRDLLINCDTCRRASDYLIVIGDEKVRLENMYNNDEYKSFILEDISQIKRSYYEGLGDIIKKKK